VIDEELLEDPPRPAPLPAHRDLEAQELAGREDPGVLLRVFQVSVASLAFSASSVGFGFG